VKPHAGRRSQGGFSGVLVLAALVLMGGMSAYGVSLVTSVHSSFAQELSVARATQAAEAGMEWARFRLTRNPVPVCSALQTLNLPATLANYRVTVRCTATGVHTEGAVTVRTYRVTATACNAPACPGALSGDYVERQVQGWVQR
jgi:MSHA biogenesis protein MshP